MGYRKMHIINNFQSYVITSHFTPKTPFPKKAKSRNYHFYPRKQPCFIPKPILKNPKIPSPLPPQNSSLRTRNSLL
jgi:hypothetical protein